MKKVFLILVITIFISCEKNSPTPCEEVALNNLEQNEFEN